MKILVIMILVSSFTLARFDATPIQSCEAYNNMKHTMNTHHVILDTSRKYTVLKHHKGQNLILVKGEQPAQRWVDDECFSKKTKMADDLPSNNEVVNIDDELHSASVHMSDDSNHNTVNQNISPNNLLVLSWHNAFCETLNVIGEFSCLCWCQKQHGTNKYYRASRTP